jgi:hypothetical protein
MNQIIARNATSEYSKGTEHLNIFIDEKPLDEIADNKKPDYKLKGLVPTLLDWLDNPNERKLVWERILPEEGQTTYVPVLMCPDDVDLSCTTIIAEAERKGETIFWHKLGIDFSRGDYENYPNYIGTTVEWFENIEPMEFRLSQYELMLDEFRKLI